MEALVSANLKVLVHDEKGIVFDGVAVSVSSVNARGPFDILHGHTNFITLLKEKLLIQYANGQIKAYTIESGILYAFSSNVEVYLGIEAISPK